VKVLSAIFVRGHRALFTAATATLGVAGSLLATDASEPGNWLLLAGSGLVMGVEDLCREIESDAHRLTVATQEEMPQTRLDVLETHRPRVLGGAIVLGLLLLIGGGVLRAM
jgi:hypothetical protein